MVESVTSELWVVASRRPIRPFVRPYVHPWNVFPRHFACNLHRSWSRDRDATIVDESVPRREFWRRKLDAWPRVSSNVLSFGSHRVGVIFKEKKNEKRSYMNIRKMSTTLVLKIKYVGGLWWLNKKNITSFDSFWKGTVSLSPNRDEDFNR